MKRRADATDAEIVRECLAGDRDAFGVLVDRHKKVIFNVAFQMLKDRSDAEDAAQCVFIRAYERLGSYNPQFKFFSWIYRMTVNESLNRIRGRRDTTELHESMLVSNPETPDKAVSEAELEDRMGEALMELVPEDRALILLRHYEDMPYRDLGFVFEIPIKTVKSRLFTARRRLCEICRRRGMMPTGGIA
ncbi:MAG: RNA polymerase sigma-70 factor (ECF subfamily) [Rhodothermales bacterium]|jgi:RNA polymerase sigma-70 factor (ECF subfamily)